MVTETVVCRSCGAEHPVELTSGNLCPDCQEYEMYAAYYYAELFYKQMEDDIRNEAEMLRKRRHDI